MGKTKSLITIGIILIPIIISLCLPKIRYKSFDIIEYLNIPLSIGNWLGKEIPNTDEELKKKFTFINKSKQFYFWKNYGTELYQYYSFSKEDGTEIYFTLLNAGNFHNPKSCYTGIGYKPRHEGKDNIILGKNTNLQFDTYLMLKKNNDLLTTFWMCIDGKRVNWLEQKLNELICSLTNRNSINVLARIDVPTNPNNIDNALTVTKDFIRELYRTLDKDKNVYIFGE